MKASLQPPRDSALANPAELMRYSESVAHMIYELTDVELEDTLWEFDFKARYNSTEIVAGVAAAVGSIDPQDAMIRLGYVRSLLFELHSALKLAIKTKRFCVEPELMVMIEWCIKQIDKELDGLPARAVAWRNRHNLPVPSVDAESLLTAVRKSHNEI